MAEPARLKQGARVRIHRDPDAPAGTVPPPPGVWMVLSRSPLGPSYWWLMAYDAEARTWAATDPRVVVSGCITQPGWQLDLINVRRL